MGKFDDLNTVKLGQILDDPEGKAVLAKHLGDMLNNPLLKLAKKKPMEAIFEMAKSKLPAEKVEAIKAELKALS